MTIAIKTANNDVYVFTAVTAFSENYASKATEHPIEGRTNVTDHVITNQPSYRLSGIIVPSDIGGATIQSSRPSMQYHGASNVTADSVVIETQKESVFSALVPEAFSNLMEGDKTSVSFAEVDDAVVLETMKKTLVALKDSAAIVSLILFDGAIISEIIDDCLIESIAFEDTPETGEALDISMTLTKAEFVTLGITSAPTLTWKEIDLSGKDSGSKGAQQGATQGNGTPTGKVKPPAAVQGFDECQFDAGRNRSPINCLVKKVLAAGLDTAGGI